MNRQRGVTLTLILYGLVALAVVAAVGFGVRAIYNAGAESVQVKWDAAVDAQALKEVQQSGAAASSLEKSNAKARVVYRTITQEVDKYIDRPVYRDACFDDDGLRDANLALQRPGTVATKPDGTVPRPGATGGQVGGLRPPQDDRSGGAVLRVPAEAH